MNGHRAFQHYLALKKHFSTDKYDIFEKPRVDIPEEVFNKRNDRKLWDHLTAVHPSTPFLMDFMVANFAYGLPGFVYEIEAATENHKTWQKRRQSRIYTFETDAHIIADMLTEHKISQSSFINFNGPSPPLLLNMFLGKRIGLETMVILNDGLGYIDQWKGQMSFFFENEIRRIDKSQRFIRFNKEMVKDGIEAIEDSLKQRV